MSQPSHDLTIPRYMRNFSCIGPECERTCCAHWTVPVDNATQKAFRKAADKEARAKLLDGLTPTRELKMDEKGNCHFLAEDGWCVIHRDMGESMLPRICRVYPRGIGQGEAGKELHGTLSCPELARKMLFDPQALDIVGTEPARTFFATDDFSKILWEMEPTHDMVTKATMQLTEGLIRDRSQPMWQGVMDVVTLYYTWAEGGAKNAEDCIPMLESLATLAAEGAWRNKWADSRINPDLQIQHVRGFARGVDKIKVKLDDETDLEELVPRYQAAFRDYVEPYMQANPHVFENLMCGELRHLGAHQRLYLGWRHVAQVALLYGYVKAALTLRATVTQQISDADVVDVVVDAWRHIRHAKWFAKAIGGNSETSVPEYVLNIIADPTHEPVPVA